jgi:phosphonoacetaldehyde hydrolase
LFAGRGMTVTEEESRRDMGIHKKDHIRALLRAKTGKPPHEAEVENLFAAFIPMQMDCLAAHSAVIPGVPSVAAELRARGIKIGSTTGYTRPMLDVLLAAAAAQDYRPDCALCPDETVAGRPWPWMCYLNAIRLRTCPMQTMVKIGDTISDIEEGSNAGMWTVGIARTGNMIGLAADELAALSPAEQAARLDAARRKLREAGAHYIADAVADCIPLVEQIEERLAKGESP